VPSSIGTEKGDALFISKIRRKIWLIVCMSAIVTSSGCTLKGRDSKEVEPSPILGLWAAGEAISLTAPKDCILITSDHYVDLAEK
jgi:hypothetical protein